MKNLVFILFFALTLVSCSKEDNASFDINGTFNHEILNCDNSNNPEMNCVSFIKFMDSLTVSALIGGGDIVYSTNYTIDGDTIIFEKSSELNYDISFKIINETTLKRIQDDAIFLKEE